MGEPTPEAGERIVGTEALHGGITAEMRRLTIGAQGGGTRDLVLKTFVEPFFVKHSEDRGERGERRRYRDSVLADPSLLSSRVAAPRRALAFP